MSVFNKHRKPNENHLISEGFKVYKESDIRSSYYDFKSEIQYFPKGYKGNIRVYGKEPSDMLCGWIGEEFKIINEPDMDDIMCFKNLNKNLI